MKEQNTEIFELGKQAAFSAGKILMDNFGKIKKVSKKADGSFVTNADISADREIVSLIKDKFPDHSILTEESGECPVNSGPGKKSPTLSEYRWIIDPLDGTHNYVHGLDIFGVSICVTHIGEPLIGIIYFPCSNKLYHCEKGSGAYLNGERIHVSTRTKLKDALLTHNSNFRSERMFEGFKKLVDSVFKVRILGACVAHLCHIADGRTDADVEYDLNPWDYFAGALIVEEAGGRVTDFAGKPWHLSSGPHIASNGLIHNEILKLMNELH